MAKRSLCRHHPRWEPYASIGLVRIWCSEASCHSSGCKSRQHRSPVDAVVISSDGKGDRPVESLEVKAPDGWETGQIRARGASNLTGRSNVRTTEAAKDVPRVKRIAGDWECRAGQISAKAYVDTAALELIGIELPVVREDCMPGRNGQRKPGTTRGSPRRSRTAKAAHISRRAMKLCCACEWGAWGRLSVDGSRQHNSNRSEDPWGGGLPILQGGALTSPRPGSVRE